MVPENAKRRKLLFAVFGAIMIFLTVMSCSTNEEKADLMLEVDTYSSSMGIQIYSKIVVYPYIFLNLAYFEILKLDDSYNLQFIKEIACRYESPDMEIKDSVIYFLHDDYIFMMSVKDMENPIITDSVFLSDEGVSLVIKDNNIYILTKTNGLMIYSLNDEKTISKIGEYKNIEDSKSMELIEHNLYISCGNNGWIIIDVTDIENPAEKCRVETTGWTLKTALKDSILYTAEWDKGVNVYVLSEDGSVDSITTIKCDIAVKEVYVNENYMYATGEYGECKVFDITTPFSPVFYADSPNKNFWNDYFGQMIFDNEYVYVSCYCDFGVFKLNY